MSLPETSRIQFTSDLQICRVLNGMWQVSGGHGEINPPAALRSMRYHFDAGLTTFDLADHYGPAEDLMGELRRTLQRERDDEAVAQLQAFTKWVPRPGRMTRRVVEEAVDLSRRRMQTDCLDMLQFHWWNYDNSAYLDALGHLTDLRYEGKIRHIGLTNFDTKRLEIIVSRGFEIVSNQVQFSLIDRRPQLEMVKLCQEVGIQLLTYGTVCGGFLSANYLGQPEPDYHALETVSLRKYKQLIDAWGGWSLFQRLLGVLKDIADQYEVSLTAVALRAILESPQVAGVIVGVRFGLTEHVADNTRLFEFDLTEEDQAQIDQVVSQSRNLFQLIGDCGDEYRR